jgi:ureidoacrylate peracid hydrolase
MIHFDDDPLVEDLDPDRTAIIVVNMMNEFVQEGAVLETPMAHEMVPDLQRVIEEGRDAGAHGWPPDRDLRGDPPEPEDVIVEKQTYTGFFWTELETVLRSPGVETVVITGVAIHICNDPTIRGDFFGGYNVVALADCNATFDIADQGWGDVSAEEINRRWFT